jgi:hypothetical protein
MVTVVAKPQQRGLNNNGSGGSTTTVALNNNGEGSTTMAVAPRQWRQPDNNGGLSTTMAAAPRQRQQLHDNGGGSLRRRLHTDWMVVCLKLDGCCLYCALSDSLIVYRLVAARIRSRLKIGLST